MSAFYINLHVENVHGKWFVLDAMEDVKSGEFDTKEEAEKEREKMSKEDYEI